MTLARMLAARRQIHIVGRAAGGPPTGQRPVSRYAPGSKRERGLEPGVSPLVSPPPVHFPSDPNAIVTVQVKTIIAPTPNTYQQTGCLVSFGGTTLNDMECQELTQRSDLDLICPDPATIESITWANGVATVTMADPDEVMMPSGDPGFNFHVNISGVQPSAYNGANLYATVIDSGSSSGTPQFSYPLAADPGGPATSFGAAQTAEAAELSQMATTYFSQGNAISVYVLELGPEFSMTGKRDALQEWLETNPRSFYGYLMPRSCANTVPNYQVWKSLLAQYESPEAMTYFWFTVTPDTMRTYLDDENGTTFKCIVQHVEAPIVTEAENLSNPFGEFTAAAMFYNAIIYRPSQTNPIAPMAFKFVYGVTQYPTQNNGPLLVSFKDCATNYISNGAEGGIAFTIIYTGVTLDGQDYFNWWWTIDYLQIQINIDLSNAIINGANNALAPLYYNQNGINFMQATLAATMANAITFGMVAGGIMMSQLIGPDLQQQIQNGAFAGMCDVNAVPFISYTRANPSHYKIGEYRGLSTLFIPQRGFIHVLVTIAASELVSV